MKNTEDGLLEKLASLHRTKVVSTVESFDYKYEPLNEENASKFMSKTEYRILISNDGTIFSSLADNRLLSLATKIVGKEKGIPADRVKIVFCYPQVLMQVVATQRQDRIAITEKEEEATERTDAQMSLDSIVDRAVRNDSSDIHIFFYEHYAVVRFRIDGLLRVIPDSLSKSHQWNAQKVKSACATAVNAEAARDNGVEGHFNKEEPIDATFPITTSKGRRKIRYAQTPTQSGFKVVMRILAYGSESTKDVQSVQDHGYLKEQAMLIEETSLSSSGLAIVAGPTGSGKTTTLGTMVGMIPSVNSIYTYEDPIENILSNACQVPVKPKSERCNWKSLSKNSLRLDPDVIMYGELRDNEVATEIVHAATTGHFVLTTLHTNSAIACVTRLNDLGISYNRLAEPGFLKLLVFQRLIPKICDDCSVAIDTVALDRSPIMVRRLSRYREHFAEETQSLKFANTVDNDCEKCGGTGVRGRLLVAEVITVDSVARNFISKGDMFGWEKSLKERGWRNIMAHAEIHVRSGLACPIESESRLSDIFGAVEESDGGFDYSKFREEISPASARLDLVDV